MGTGSPAELIEDGARDFLAASPANSMTGDGGERVWDDILIGYARGDDPLFAFLKEDIGPFYWTPEEIFSETYPDILAKPGELTVVGWVLPQSKATRDDHRREKTLPSERWSRARHYGENFNAELRLHLVALLLGKGFPALAPTASPLWERKMSDRYGFASRWSERHAAYAAGLGTFGLSDGLITARGKAVRCGSIIVKADIPPTPRPYTDHRAYCLFFSTGNGGGKCGVCAKRCPAGAISAKGHDKDKCKTYIRGTTSTFVRDSQLGFAVNSCGLCQTGVPCESRIPARKSRTAPSRVDNK